MSKLIRAHGMKHSASAGLAFRLKVDPDGNTVPVGFRIATARFAQGLSDRIANGEFSIEFARQ